MVAAIVDLGHHRWLRLKARNGKPANSVTRPAGGLGAAALQASPFEKQFDASDSEPRQKLLILAPLSGHHATLLRGAVEAFLPFYDVYITDWVDG
jgi:hypothetical protein